MYGIQVDLPLCQHRLVFLDEPLRPWHGHDRFYRETHSMVFHGSFASRPNVTGHNLIQARILRTLQISAAKF